MGCLTIPGKKWIFLVHVSRTCMIPWRKRSLRIRTSNAHTAKEANFLTEMFPLNNLFLCNQNLGTNVHKDLLSLSQAFYVWMHAAADERGFLLTRSKWTVLHVLYNIRKIYNSTFIRVLKRTQQYQVFAYMIKMILDHRLDSARQVHSSSSVSFKSYFWGKGEIPIELSFTLQPWCLNMIPLYQCISYSAWTSSSPSNVYAKSQVYAHSAAVSQMTLKGYSMGHFDK